MSGPFAGIDSDVWISASPSVNTTNEACTDSGDHTTYVASVHLFWDDNATLTVQNSPNGSTSWVTVTDYVFQYPTGTIVFNSARVVNTNNHVRISTGNYFTVTQLDASYKWALSLKGKSVKTTTFQSAGAWDKYTGTTRELTGTVDTYRNESRLFSELTSTNNQVILILYVSKTHNYRWQFAARVTAVNPSSDTNGVQMQSLAFEATKEIYFLTS